MRATISALALLLLSTGVRAEIPDWSQLLGGSGNDVGFAVAATDAQGEIVIAGSFESSANIGGAILTSQGLTDIFLAKFSSRGGLVWAKRFGGSGNDQPRALSLDPVTGDILLSGRFPASINFGTGTLTSAGANDVFVARFTSAGAVRWAQRIGGAGDDSCAGVVLDTGGNAIVAGHFSSSISCAGQTVSSVGGNDIYLAAFSPSGSGVWCRPYGGTRDDLAEGIAIDGDGRLVVVGSFDLQTDLGGGQIDGAALYDIYVASYSAIDGSFRWAKAYGGSGYDSAYAVAIDGADLVVTGYFGLFGGSVDFGGGPVMSHGGADAFVARYAVGDGSFRWAYGYGGTADEYLRSIALDPSGNIFVTGDFQGTTNFGGNTFTSAGQTDVIVAKYSAAGAHLWSQRFGSLVNDKGNGIATDPSGNSIVTGFSLYQIDFGGGAMSSSGLSDSFLAKFDPDSSAPQATATFTATFTATYTPIPPTLTRTPTNTAPPPSATRTATPTASFTASATMPPPATSTPLPTNTPAMTSTAIATGTPTGTATHTPTRTSTFTATSTATRAATNTATWTATRTPTNTATRTPTSTATRTATNTATATATRTSTQSPTRTPTQTSSRTPSITPTATSTRTATQTGTRTSTATPPSPSLPPTATRTSTNSPLPSATPTITLTRTPSSTATKTNTPLPSATFTVTPPNWPGAFPGLALWLDAGRISGVANGGAVSTWVDVSGGGHHATQTSITSKPTYLAADINGKPAVRFDGTYDYLSLAGSVVSGSASRTVFVVAQPTVIGNRGFIDLGNGSTTGAAFMLTSEYAVRVNGGNTVWGTVATTGIPALFVVELTGTDTGAIDAWLNGAALSVSATTSTNVATTGSGIVGSWSAAPIGSNNYAGDIAEIVVYNRALSVSERQTLEQFFSTKYALTWQGSSTPASTPTSSNTPTATSTITSIPSSTATPVLPPSATATATTASVATATATALPADTSTPTLTATALPADTSTPTLTATAPSAPTTTPTSNTQGPTPTVNALNPQSVANLVLWLDASQVVGAVEGGGVGTWSDASGLAHNGTQASANSQPTFHGAAVNGKPALRFDGVDDYLSLSGAVVSGAQSRTVFFAARPSVIGNKGIIDLGNGTTPGAGFLISPEYGVRVSGGSRLWLPSASTQTVEVGTVQFAGSDVSDVNLWINGSLRVPASTLIAPVQTSGSGTVGAWTASPIGNNNFVGDIAEIIVYSRALTPAEQQGIQQYLSAKYLSPSPPQPDTVPGLELWLDASRLSGVSAGGAIASWPDSSGAGHNATQQSGSSQPTYQPTAVNGKPAVRFNGSSDYLSLAGTVVTGTQSRTVIWVGRPDTIGNRGVIDLGDGVTTGGAFMITPENGVRVMGGSRLWNPAPGTTQPSIGVIVLSGTNTNELTAWLNGAPLTVTGTNSATIQTTGAGTVGSWTRGPIGANNFSGDIAEILVYDRVLSDAERQSIQSNLSIKYEIPIS